MIIGRAFLLKQKIGQQMGEVIADRKGRLAWLDAIRGLTIMTIPIVHAALMLESAGFATTRLLVLAVQFQTAGMALFFSVSGMNARRYIDGDWKTCWRDRLMPIVWMLLVWGAIQWIIFGLFPDNHNSHIKVDWWRIPLGILLPTSFLWFLWALAAYLILAKTVRNLNRYNVLIVSGVVSSAMLGASNWHLEHYGLGFIARDSARSAALTYFIFFYIGYCYREIILRVSQWYLLPSLLIFLGGSILLTWLASHIFFVPLLGAIRLSAALLGLVGTIFIGRLVLSVRFGRRIVLTTGRLTLPIYLVHVPVLSIIVWFIRNHISGLSSTSATILAVEAGTFSTVLSIGLALSAKPLRLSWLFKPPMRESIVVGLQVGRN